MSKCEEPTIAAFNTLIDAHMHIKATANAASSARINSQPNRGRGGNGRNNQSGQPGQQNRQPLTDAEKKRRQKMKGKCFRCANADHFANNCPLAKDIKCKRCNNTGHILAACTQPGAKANATSDQEREQERENPVLQLEYRPATQDKYAESRVVGDTQYLPVQPVPFPAQIQHPDYYADSCAVTRNNDIVIVTRSGRGQLKRCTSQCYTGFRIYTDNIT